MRMQKSGLIINTSSIGGKVYTPLGSWYHATKHALEGWSDCLRIELKQFGIHVVVIEPGGIKTPWGLIAADNMERLSRGTAYEAFAGKAANGMRKRYDPKGSLTDPKEIAEVVERVMQASNPRPRYLVGKFAGTLLLVRRLLGDRLFDRIILKVLF